MGSQYAPEWIPLIDTGTAPTFLIDGIESVREDAGLVRTSFFVTEHLHSSGPQGRLIRRLVLHLVYSAAAQRVMRDQVVALHSFGSVS